MTKKEELLNEIYNTPLDHSFVAFGQFMTGENVTMRFSCPQSSLVQIIFNLFDDDLVGAPPHGYPMQIYNWDWE